MKSWMAVLILLATRALFAGEIDTNEVHYSNAPKWLTQARIERVVDRVQRFMAWDIRKIQVLGYADEAAFEKMHGFGPSVLAVSRRSDNSIHVGPQVINSNFDAVFGHELVHIILFQKYKSAVPAWLDEGLANYVGKHGSVDYRWLASQTLPDVHTLTHPFTNSAVTPRFHYMASTALIEMIAAKCDLKDLLDLSVGKSLETYLINTCGIADVNSEFAKWLARKKRSFGS